MYLPFFPFLPLRIGFPHRGLGDHHVHVVILVVSGCGRSCSGRRRRRCGGDGFLEGPLRARAGGARGVGVRVGVEVEGVGVWTFAAGRHWLVGRSVR